MISSYRRFPRAGSPGSVPDLGWGVTRDGGMVEVGCGMGVKVKEEHEGRELHGKGREMKPEQ